MKDMLKIIALDSKDMQVVSACIQDSLTRLAEIKYNKNTRQLSLALRRYVWEKERYGWWIFNRPRRERRLAVLHFNCVKSVKSQNINNKDKVLSLLAIEIKEIKSLEKIILHFAEGAKLLLEVEAIEAQLTDQSGGWKSRRQPNHEKIS